MSRIKLTAGGVRDFTTTKTQEFRWDTEAPGLGVRATNTGAKAYIFQGKLNGQAIRITIGNVDTWPLESVRDRKTGEEVRRGAREEARRLKALLDRGVDPREEKRERIAAHEVRREKARQVEAPALGAWQEYVKARSPKWSPSHIRDHATVSKEGGEKRTRGRRKGESDITQPGALRRLLLLPLAKIDPGTVKAWLEEESNCRPTHARLAFGLLRAFLNWCGDSPKYREQAHPEACTSRLAKNTLPKKAAKDDALQREQLPAWFETVKRIKNPVISAYLQTLLLTGARREEMAALTWEGLDLQCNSMTIHDKLDGERTIPLTPYVARLLAALPRRRDREGNPLPWVFSSPTAADGKLAEPRIQHVKALQAAGLPHVTLHGLRRSFGTLAEWVECPTSITAQIMGHKPSALAEKHYRRRPLDLLRMWHTKIEAWMLEQAGIEQPKAEEATKGLRVVSRK